MIIYKLEESYLYDYMPIESKDYIYFGNYCDHVLNEMNFDNYEKVPDIYFVRRDGKDRFTVIRDYYYCFIPVFSEKSISVIGDLIPNNSELKLLNNVDKKNKDKFYVLNIKDRIDCFDIDKLEFRGGSISKYSFIESKIPQKSSIFKPFTSRADNYVTQEFVDRVIENNLRGFTFIPLWDSEKGSLCNPLITRIAGVDQTQDWIHT